MARNEKHSTSGGGVLSSVLISLAAAFGLTVIGLGAGFGAGMVMYGPLDIQAEGPATVQDQPSQEPGKASYIGPNLRIENGEVVWRRDGTYPIRSTEPQGNTQENAQDSNQQLVNAPPDEDQEQTPNTAPDTSSNNTPTSTPNQQQPTVQVPSQNNAGQSEGNVNVSPNQPAVAKPNTTQPSSSVGDFSNGQVLATKASNNSGDPVYHTKYCSAALKIAESDKIWYSSAKAAEDAGRRICGICNR